MSRLVALALFLVPAASLADVPLVIEQQGRLLDGSDQPVEGTVRIEASIFALPVAPGTNPESALWSEEYDVTVAGGLYTIALGDSYSGTKKALDLSVFTGAGDRYLELSVQGVTLSPRLRIASVPFALDASNLGGKPPEFYAKTADLEAAKSDLTSALAAESDARASAVADEATARDAAIATATTTLQAAVDAEATARATADTTEQNARASADAAEQSARASADTSLQQALAAEAASRTGLDSATAKLAADNAFTGATNTFSGKVGLGSQSPNFALDVGTGIGSASGFDKVATTNLELFTHGPTSTGEGIVTLHHSGVVAHELKYANGTLSLEASSRPGYSTNATPNFTVGGDLGVGTKTPGTTMNQNQASWPSYSPDARALTVEDAAHPPALELAGAPQATGDQIGGLWFTNLGGQSDAHLQVAGIYADRPDWSGAANVVGGRLDFVTKVNGNGVLNKMVFDNNGRLGVGTDAPGAQLEVKGDFIRTIARWQGYAADNTDNGQLSGRTVTVTKHDGDTGLRVTWSDNFRVTVNNEACRWEVMFNGRSCANPGGLYFDKYEGNTSSNRHDPSTFVGTCFGLAAGQVVVTTRVYSEPGYSGADCYTGWNNALASLEVEEVR